MLRTTDDSASPSQQHNHSQLALKKARRTIRNRFRNLLSAGMQSEREQPQRKRSQSRKSRLEPLEGRQMMAGDVPEITSGLLNFYLADIATDEAIVQVHSGDVVPAELLEGREVTLFAEAKTDQIEHQIKSVRIEVPGIASRTENKTPYSVTGDRGGDFRRSIDLEGNVEVIASAHSRFGARGDVLEAVDFNFRIESDPTRSILDVTDLPDEILDSNPGLVSAVPGDDVDDLPAIDAAIAWLSDQLESGQAESATLYLPEGTYLVSGSIDVDAAIDIQGAGSNQTRLAAIPTFGFDGTQISDNGISVQSVTRDGYLIDFDRNSDGASLRDVELYGPQMIGGVFAFRSDDLEISQTRFDTFLWSGLRTFNLTGSEIHNNEFFDAGGRKVKADGSFGVTGGGIFSTFHDDSSVYNNDFLRRDDREVNFFGIKGRKWSESRIHHNTINTSFSVELPFENDRAVEI
ncbi:MAG: glycosyl hydrolase family 28-related protein, partial [Planctomycetota bacterium]